MIFTNQMQRNYRRESSPRSNSKSSRRKVVSWLCLLVVSMTFIATATPSVTGVTAKQRYPWNGLVDITVTLSGTEEECTAAAFPFYVTNKTTRAELPIESVKLVGAIAGAGNTWTRRFVWNATADVGCAKFGEVELTVGALVTDGVQLWENGPYWAEYNVGATKSEEYGYYFWWGDTIGYKRNAANNGWVSVKDGSSFSFREGYCSTCGKNESQLQSEGYIDATGNLVAAHDAATAHLGALWRMPTSDEVQALVDNCTMTWTNNWNGTGVNGQLVTGKGTYASKSIFLPAAGYGYYSDLNGLGSEGDYWSSTPESDYTYDRAWYLYFRSGTFGRNSHWRERGLSVRPVRGFAQ